MGLRPRTVEEEHADWRETRWEHARNLIGYALLCIGITALWLYVAWPIL